VDLAEDAANGLGRRKHDLAEWSVMQAPRPLSPHLQVYRLALGTVLSGLHRISGVALSAGSLLLVGWLVAAARGAETYATAIRFFSSVPVRLVLAGALAAFWYHLFAGLRHMAWDLGLGFEKSVTRKSGMTVIALAVLMSIVTLTLARRFFLAAP
jgi:succinate dehydrogenase / fumarate reductase cytochrome b subunit